MNWRCTLWGHRWGHGISAGTVVTFVCQRERCWEVIARMAAPPGLDTAHPDPRAESNVHRRGAG